MDQFMVVELNNKFGMEKEISITTNLVNKYLGLTINFSLRWKVVFSMFGYIEDIILEALEDMRCKNKKDVLIPAIKGIFNMDEDNEDLDGTTNDLFHNAKNTSAPYIPKISPNIVDLTVTSVHT